ncbi:MAG: histidine kinase, partial [Acutalibacteraceae bacterium]|nr:histidine kinase [Acutalibacteraceae bacterium]
IIISALLVLGIAIFSYMLDKNNFKNYLFCGFLILSAGLFFLFTSEAIYLWSDLLIVNTILKGISAMAYFLFAFVLVKDLLSATAEKAANVVTLLYGVFTSSLIVFSVFSKIYFYDILGVWAVGAAAFAVIFIVLSLLSVKHATVKQKFSLIFVIIGLLVFLADIAAAYFGLWQTGYISKIYFLIGFIISAVVFLRIVPKNIKEAKKAEQLEKEKITLDAELARSRISTLMSQIHPHFIYNTLGSIEQLCELDPPKAAKLVNDFSKYLRGNFCEIDNTRLICVSKELEHTEYYIGIEKVRFPDIEFITEMDCCDFSIPALTIQPIVENAVKHGILKRESGGTVKVKVYETDCSYFISVKDNGVGFDVTEIESENHIGLRNIKSRLEAMCGGILHIESIVGVGTKITVEIPKEAD